MHSAQGRHPPDLDFDTRDRPGSALPEAPAYRALDAHLGAVAPAFDPAPDLVTPGDAVKGIDRDAARWASFAWSSGDDDAKGDGLVTAGEDLALDSAKPTFEHDLIDRVVGRNLRVRHATSFLCDLWEA